VTLNTTFRGTAVISKVAKPSRYLVGIDLGTTHTVAAYADTAGQSDPAIELFAIDQLVAPGAVAAWPLLPSLRYHPAPGELVPNDIRLPWPAADPGGVADCVIGELARELGSRVPGRLVASAKSWLSHPAVDRTAPILPWGAAPDVPRVSPVAASAGYLAHVRAAWNQQFPEHLLERQELVLTVPASFDEAARSLTVAAARAAGLGRAWLVEEPQAACYDWIHRHRHDLAAALGDTRLLLVCDVGGGTTDLTLIRAELTDTGPRFTRIGVGDHLLLGGDNMDLTLAHVVERRLGGERLSAAGLSQLLQQCRLAKERLLAPSAPEHTSVTVLGSGTRLIGAARSAELRRDEVQALVVDGFFPSVDPGERPQRRRTGILEFGLPYTADPAITRHLAAFLSQHEPASRQALGERAPAAGRLPLPEAVLLNGGVFQSEVMSRRLLEVLAAWRGESLRRLHNDQPSLAVARGAVAYGLARRGQGVRIGGGSARSYFLIVSGERGVQQGVCLLPKGAEEEHEIHLSERSFSLRLDQPVRFHLVSFTGDAEYRPGKLVDIDYRTFTTLPPIATVLESGGGGGEIPVQLATRLTEVGTLEIDCLAQADPTRRWQLAFQLRGGDEAPAAVIHPRFREAVELLERFYGARSREVDPKAIKALRPDLEKILGKRESWDTALLRELFGVLWRGAKRRRRSPAHERMWLSLAGFCLRPGYGYPLDDWRVRQLWSLYDQGIQYTQDAQIMSEWWTLWRRVAGGLDEAAQERLLDDLADHLKPAAARSGKSGKESGKTIAYDDIVRLAAALERVSATRKEEIGGRLLQRLGNRNESPQTWWAVGRLGSRVPQYGSIHTVVPRETAEHWLRQTFTVDWKQVQPAAFAATLLGRVSGDRERDLDPSLRREAIQRLRTAKAPETWVRLLQEAVELDEADEKRVFGEALPPGLRVVV
jgi:molecular chaperone DnaK (HSP70)